MLNKAPCSPPGRRATPTKALLTQWSQGASQPNANGNGSSPQQQQQPLKAPLSIHNINTRVINSEYAVRGEIVQLAQKIAKELEECSRSGSSSSNGNGASSSGSSNGEGGNGVQQQQQQQRRYPFDKVVWCNIGNPQILGQQPITYFRQVLALCECPQLLDHPNIRDIFPSDVIDRARMLLEAIPGGVGAYSDSAGAYVLRQLVASAIEKRDGYGCSPDDIYMTDGASPAVHYMMDLLLRCNSDGLMVPIPQYPLYSATLTLYGGRLVPYMLDEHNGWGLDVGHLRQQLAAGREQGLCVRGMVVINPGNPTGQCLSYRNMEDILRFAAEEELVIIADEVYQANIYVDGREFFSFKKVAADLGLTDAVPLVSLHSISKGFIGECGRRGGYMEVTGFPAAVKDQILKLASINLCPNLSGQICCALMMNPPQPGEPSYAQYVAERDSTLGSLRRRAELLVAALNRMEGVTCNTAEGALYAFPRITLPQRACDEARRIGKAPDWLYCKELLEATGIVVVPGSGFGQQDGTFHFRTTFLPSEQDMVHVVQALADFHKDFLAKYGGISTAQQQQQQPELVAVGAGSNGAALSNGKAH